MITAKTAKKTAKTARKLYINNLITEAINKGNESITIENSKYFKDIEEYKPELEKLGYEVIKCINEYTVRDFHYENLEAIKISWESINYDNSKRCKRKSKVR